MTENLTAEPGDIKKKKYFNYDLFCTEFTIFSETNKYDQSDPFLFAQSFADRIKIWWPTNIGLDGFLKSVNTFAQSSSGLAANVNDDRKAFRDEKKCHYEVFFYLNNYKVEHVQIKDCKEININSLANFIESDWRIRLLRIALPGVDFYYDFEPHENFIRRAGIVTKLNCDSIIFDYIHSTHSQYVQHDTLKEIVKDILNCMSQPQIIRNTP